MRPRRLRIKGLNSFIEEQEIDFQRLTDKGLFGIFGPTGSGKSTILDAITMALYGNISRDTREFMNTTCSSLSVSYEFEIGVGSERKTYIADRIINKDKAGSYKLKTSRLREICEEKDTPIAEGATEVKSMVERIVGLTADDFTRSVVLPQGKFSEFLKLTGKDRRNMLERIFRLERFGRNLGDKIRLSRKEKNDSLNVLAGRISGYEERGVSEEKYNLLKKELKELTAEESRLKKEKASLDNDYEKYKVVWELQQELEGYRSREREQEQRAGEFEVKKQRLLNAQNAQNVKPLLEELRELEIKIKANEEELNRNQALLENIKRHITATENEHKVWLEKKEKELPVLIERETNLTRAIELEEKLKVIDKEITDLRQEYQNRSKRQDALNEDLAKTNKARDKAAEEKTRIEKRLEEIKIDPEYRDKVQKASQTEDEYLKFIKEKEETEQKCKSKTLSIGKLEAELQEVIKNQEQYYREIALTEDRISVLSNNVPGDNTQLITIREKTARLEAVLKELEINISKRKELEGSLSSVLKEKEELEATVNKTAGLVAEKKEALRLLELEIKNIERSNLASILAAELKGEDPCPVCGSTHHPELAESFEDEELEGKRTLKESLEKLIVERDRSLRELEVKLGASRNSEAYIRRDLEEAEKKIGNLDLETVKSEKEEGEKSFRKLSTELEEWNNNKELTEKDLNKKKDEKSLVDKNEVKLTENIKNEKNALEDLRSSLLKLNEWAGELEKQYKEFKAELGIEDFKNKVKELRDFDREGSMLHKSLKEAETLISTSDKTKEALNKELNDLQVELAKIMESGKEKRLVFDRDKSEISRLSQGRNPGEFLVEARKERKDIIDTEDRLRVRLEKEKEERQKLSDKILSEQTVGTNLRNQQNAQKEKLKGQLELYSFLDEEQVRKCLMAQSDFEKLEKEINSFEEAVKNTKDNIERVSKKLNGNAIDEDTWQQLRENRAETEELLQVKVKAIAQKSQSMAQIEKELEELKELKVKKKELEHVCSNLEDLAKLVEGNKFVEFVAMNQLRYISMEASKRLKDITRGRYALEIDSTGNFIMRDDFNGGSRRATSTLSGGETFLTSLCLALSLSSQIQLKGSAPLEFFFLDEGFGTLDSDLLEIVMGSLERLHSDRLCVGIISHVEELKSRVPIKLLVEPAEHGRTGSRVRIELT
jgi:DNA repair protein SbcC/Rad50